MPIKMKPRTVRLFTRPGPPKRFLIFRVSAGVVEFSAGEEGRAASEWYGWKWPPLVPVAKAIVAGDMPLYAAADWFEDNAGVWLKHRRKEVGPGWLACIRLLREFAYTAP